MNFRSSDLEMDEEVVWNIYGTYDLCGQTIFDVFTENYALFKLIVIMKYEDAPFFIEKYNTIGWDSDNDYFNLYENPSLNKKIREIKIKNIQEIKRLK